MSTCSPWRHIHSIIHYFSSITTIITFIYCFFIFFNYYYYYCYYHHYYRFIYAYRDRLNRSTTRAHIESNSLEPMYGMNHLLLLYDFIFFYYYYQYFSYYCYYSYLFFSFSKFFYSFFNLLLY